MIGTALEHAGLTQLVDDQGRQGVAFNVLGDDDDRLALVEDFFEDRGQVADGADLLLVDEDVGIFEFALHRLGVGDEVRRDVAAIELHAFDELVVGFDRLAFFDGDDAVLADLRHRLGDDLADGVVAVGGDGGDVFQVLFVLDRDRHGS